MTHIAQLTAVTRTFSGNPRPALNDVTLSIPAGSVTAVMGPSGSGKSTLLNVIAGIDRPTTGSVVVDGVDLTTLSEAALARYRRSRVGIIFQFFNLLNSLTALDNVTIPAQLGGATGTVAKSRAMDLLDRLGVADLANRYPAHLSGGERQRVAIARALVNDPALLLADEPTGALDSHAGDDVMRILDDLHRAGQTIVLVTHDLRIAEGCADRVDILVDGAIQRPRAQQREAADSPAQVLAR
ncbi:MAG TPA: ABC transporter ATP-binding protein [Candidatus Acidoferrales bacterium]|nr:ABC transporter ATP-binding protein [Candidatus Acidoferrales bacterium]